MAEPLRIGTAKQFGNLRLGAEVKQTERSKKRVVILIFESFNAP